LGVGGEERRWGADKKETQAPGLLGKIPYEKAKTKIVKVAPGRKRRIKEPRWLEEFKKKRGFS